MTQYPQKVAHLFDEASKRWFSIFEAVDFEKKTIRIAIPREDYAPEQLAKIFLSRGVDLPAKDVRRGPLIALAAAPAPTVHQAARSGWYPGRRAFVSNTHVSRSQKHHQGHTIQPPAAVQQGWASRMQIQGDLEGWKAVAQIASYSTTMLTTLATVFAAPLLVLLDRPSFALVLVGPSRHGKSSAQLLAGSAIGFGREEDLPSLNATKAGLLKIASAIFNDHVLLVNEVGTAAGSQKTVYDALRTATYALMNGQDTIRHPNWDPESGLGGDSFASTMVFSSEITPDEWAARSGQRRDEGEQARLISLPILESDGSSIFDRSPDDVSEQELSQWRDKQFSIIRREAAKHRGKAFADYTDYLVVKRDNATRQAHKSVTRFEKGFNTDAMQPIERDIISKFAILYAGVSVAITAEVLPFERKLALDAISAACRRSLTSLPNAKQDLARNLLALRDFLQEPAVVDVRNVAESKKAKIFGGASGYSTRETGILTYTIRAHEFKKLFKTSYDLRSTLEWLDEEGLLKHPNARSSKRSNEWAQKHVTWPNGSRTRSIVLVLPRGMTDLTVA